MRIRKLWRNCWPLLRWGLFIAALGAVAAGLYVKLPSEPRWVLAGGPKGVFNAGDGWIATYPLHEGEATGPLQLWDAVTNRTGFLHRNALGSMNSVAWSPDSRLIASGGNDKIIQVWDTITRNSTCFYQGHTGYITSIAWSPDRSRLASGSVDHTLQIWRPL